MGGARNLVWRNDLQARENLFTEPFKRKLRKEFSISDDGIRSLSGRLTTIVVESRPLELSILPAIHGPIEGIKSTKDALNQLRQAKAIIKKSQELFKSLRFEEAEGRPILDASELIERHINNLQKDINSLITLVVISVKIGRLNPILPYATGKPGRFANKLKTHEKRSVAVEVCFDCLAHEGHLLGYSTSSAGRQGPTIRFVQAVLGELTQPGSQINAETIRNDFRNWKEKRDMHHYLESIIKSKGL